MPWTTAEPPRKTRDLPANVRAKAVEIANRLVAEGVARQEAVRTAIGRAKRWVSRQRKLGHMNIGKTRRRTVRRVQRGRTGRGFSRPSRVGRQSGPRRLGSR